MKFHSLEELTKPEIIEEVISKCEGLGFLEGSNNKRNVALACELLAYELINAEVGTHDIRSNILMFPTVIRIFRCFPEDVEVEFIQSTMLTILNNFPFTELDKFSDMGDIYGLDPEAIVVSKYSDEVISTLGLT